MARILYGKEVSSALWERLLPRIDRLRAHGVAPTLAIVRVGERPDDLSYERTCARQADLHGIAVRRFVLPTEATQAELEAVIDAVNADPRIHGCLMFRPLPPQMDERAVCARLSPAKDIDGIGSASLAGVFADTGEGFPPATAQACLETLDFYDIPVAGKRVVVLGRSLVIGRPVAMMLLARHATVTLAHSRPRLRSRVRLAGPDGARCGHQLRCRRQSLRRCGLRRRGARAGARRRHHAGAPRPRRRDYERHYGPRGAGGRGWAALGADDS